MPSEFAHQNSRVKSIRKKLLDELHTNKVFVAWEDRNAKMVKMVIEADQTVKRPFFDEIVADMLPHGVYSYEKYPAKGLRDWAETHIRFHVN